MTNGSSPPVDLPQSAVAAGAERAPGIRIDYQKIVNAAVAVFVASGALAFIEPSPYDIAFLVVAPLWFLGGFTVQRSFLALALLLVSYTATGFLALVPYWGDTVQIPDSDGNTPVMFEYISAYIAVTAVFFALFLGNRTEERTLLCLRAYTAGAIVAAICGVLGYFDAGGLGEVFARYGRAHGPFKDPNVFGSFLVLSAVYLLQNLVFMRAGRVMLRVASLTIIVAGIFLSFSRGSWGAFIIASALMMASAYFTQPEPRMKRRIATAALIAIVLAAIVIGILLSIGETREFFFLRASMTQDYDEGPTGRFGNQMRSIPMLLERFWGFGPLRFWLTFDSAAHNSYIGAFANEGWIGGLLFILLVGVTIFVGFRLMFQSQPYQRLAQALFPPLFAFFLQAFQIDIDHWRHVFLLLGSVWGLEAARQKWDDRRENRT